MAEERDIFLRAVEGAIPLEFEERAEKPRAAPAKKASAGKDVVQDYLSDQVSYEEPDFCRPGLSSMLKKLKKLPIEDEMDLHGMNSDRARKALLAFMSHSRENGFRVVRIIHGKGYGSKDGQAVLKTKLRNWLVQIPDVLAFRAAEPEAGGSGAAVVLLKTVARRPV